MTTAHATYRHRNDYLAVHNSVEPFKLVNYYVRNTEPSISSSEKDRTRRHLEKQAKCITW